MLDLLSYSLSDFLLYSPRAYLHQIAHYNKAFWPVQPVMIMAGGALVWLLRQQSQTCQRGAFAGLALAWLWVAYAFQIERYADIHVGALGYAAAFIIEAILLLGFGVFQNNIRFAPPSHPSTKVGLAFILFGILIFPLTGLATGRGLAELEFFGLMPDPTAIVTLGVLLMAPGRIPSFLMTLPWIWLITSGTTYWTLGMMDAYTIAAIVIALPAIMIWRRGLLGNPAAEVPPGKV